MADILAYGGGAYGAGLYGAGAYGAYGAGAGGLAGLGALYSTSFLYAGFIGLGALWAALYFGGLGGGYGGGGFGGGGYGGGGYGGGGYGGGGYGGGSYGGGYPYGPQGYPRYKKPRGGHRGAHGRGLGSHGSFIEASSYDTGKGHGKGHEDYSDHHRRNKRNAINFYEDINSSYQSDIGSNIINFENEETMVGGLRRNDVNDCGPKLICEIASVKHRPLTYEEWRIMEFIRNGDELFNEMFPGKGIKADSSVLRDYQAAADFGGQGGSCGRKYKSCRASGRDMMSVISEIRRQR